MQADAEPCVVFGDIRVPALRRLFIGENLGVRLFHIADHQLAITVVYVLALAYVMGRRNKGIVNRLLVLPLQENYTAYDFHIESAEDAKTAAAAHGTFFCLFRLTG